MKNKQRHELAVCGYAAVRALAELHPHKIKRFYYTEEHAASFGFLCKELAARKIPYNQVNEEALRKLCGSVHHQGLTAMIEPPDFLPVGTTEIDVWEQQNEQIVIFDGISNVQNAGAIIRSAAFFGIKHIVLPEKEAASLISTGAYRTAQGGMELVSLYRVRSLSALLSAMEKRTLRLATDASAQLSAVNLPEIYGNNSGEGGKSIALVLGNEEHGVQKSIQRLCDYTIGIHGAFFADGKRHMDSLNVAQAAAVIFYVLHCLQNARVKTR